MQNLIPKLLDPLGSTDEKSKEELRYEDGVIDNECSDSTQVLDNGATSVVLR